jgi:hypothetical protein
MTSVFAWYTIRQWIERRWATTVDVPASAATSDKWKKVCARSLRELVELLVAMVILAGALFLFVIF